MLDVLIASSGDPQAAAAAVGIIAAVLGAIVCIFCVVMLVSIILLAIIYKAAKAVPEPHRQIEPALVWLMLIPLFNIYWGFKAFLGVSRGLQSARAAQGESDFGDCGFAVGKALCIINVISAIMSLAGWLLQAADTPANEFHPYQCVQVVVAGAMFILYIIYVVKVHTAGKALVDRSQG